MNKQKRLAVPTAIDDEEEPETEDDRAEENGSERGSLVEQDGEDGMPGEVAEMEKSGLVRELDRPDSSFRRRKTVVFLIVVAVMMAQLVYFFYDDENGNAYSFKHLKAMFSHSNVFSSSDVEVDRFSNKTNDDEEEPLLLKELRNRLVPQPLRWDGSALAPANKQASQNRKLHDFHRSVRVQFQYKV